jgi:arsenite/tail-anchored protein-transporting ATPase
MMIDKKLLLFGGKGGVGKTSMASAVAYYAASKGKRTLVLSTDPAHSLGDSFEKPIGNKITKIAKNLDGLEIDSSDLLKEYKDEYGGIIKQIANEGTFFSKDEIQEFFDLSLPGMDELMALIKIIDLLEENKYDLLILDTAPTGHTIRLLEMPELMSSYVRVLSLMRQKHRVVVSLMVGKYVKDEADKFLEKMQRDVENVKAVLKDSRKTGFVPVMIPEAMSILESEDLIEILEKHEIPVEEVFVNNIIHGNCGFCKLKKEGQYKYIKEIKNRFSKFKIKEIPLFPSEVKGENLEILAKVLFDEKYEIPKPVAKTSAEKFSFDSLKINPGLKFLLFGGKGGVGKTSMASAVALKESGKKKVLIFSTDPAHSLSDSFKLKLGGEIRKINENLDGLEIDSFSLLQKLKAQYKKEIQDFFKSVFKPTATATIDAPYDRRVMESLFDLAPPGIDEIMALKTMMDLMDGNKYDLFVLDTAPTGHALRLLELPEIAESWVRTLFEIQETYPLSFEIGDTLKEMLDTIKKIRAVLSDSKRTKFFTVAIPEAMSLTETQDLLGGLKKLKVPVEYLIVNKVFPQNDCAFCSAKRDSQTTYLKELQKLKLKMVGVEMFDKEIRGKESLGELGRKLYGL